MYKVLVSDSVAKECVDILQAVDGVTVDYNTKLTPEEFAAVIGDYDALIVRSATKLKGLALANAKKLKVVGRAGAGVDNIDVPKATEAGIIVMNTPGGNTVSTAEHAFSLMMSLARHIPQGDHSVKEGKWDRKKYMGVELRGKNIGVIGLGNIGQVVAQRAVAFGMKVLGYDPFVSQEVAESLGIQLSSLDRIWAEADFITFHTPLNDSTRHLLNAETFAKCKKGVRIINCARGGIVDEEALLAAIESGIVAGAALDVYEAEPPTNTALIAHEKVVCTPHLGASTTEAQDSVAVMVAEQVRDYLVSGEIKNAVNMPSLAPEVYEQVKPFMALGSKVGALLGQLGSGQLKGVDITYYGEMHALNTWPITASVLQGIFTRGYAEGVNLVNAKSTAEKMGIKVNETKSSADRDYKGCFEVKITSSDGVQEAQATVFGKKDARVVKLNGYSLDFVPDGYLLICGNHDRPGLIGNIGTVLGENKINIGRMTWARLSQDGDAITVLNTDQKPAKDVIAKVEAIKGITWAKAVEL